VEGFFSNGKGAKNLLDLVSSHLTPCFPLSMRWRGELKGERVKEFLFYWRSFFIHQSGEEPYLFIRKMFTKICKINLICENWAKLRVEL